MKSTCLLLLAVASTAALAQDVWLQPKVEPFERRISAEESLVWTVNAKLENLPTSRGNAGYYIPPHSLVVVDQPFANAFANLQTHQITITREMVQLVGHDEGELAYIIAHEIGHIEDANCLVRGALQGLTGVGLKRSCEKAADEIAIQYMMAAGYSAFDAAAAIGRLMMMQPGQTTVMGNLVGRFTSDHPVDMDRIVDMRVMASNICHIRADVCRGFKMATMQ